MASILAPQQFCSHIPTKSKQKRRKDSYFSCLFSLFVEMRSGRKPLFAALLIQYSRYLVFSYVRSDPSWWGWNWVEVLDNMLSFRFEIDNVLMIHHFFPNDYGIIYAP
jgi:hypothetical protein